MIMCTYACDELRIYIYIYIYIYDVYVFTLPFHHEKDVTLAEYSWFDF